MRSFPGAAGLLALVVAWPAAAEESSPDRALYLEYRARLEGQLAVADSEPPRTYLDTREPIPVEVVIGEDDRHAEPAALSAPVARTATDDASAAAPPGCLLLRDEDRRSSSSDCQGCHGRTEHSGHPLEVSYEEARFRGAGGMSLRPQAEARERGAFLPEGKVRCVSCHDGRSRLRYRLAIPRDALRPAVHAGDRRTYDPAFVARGAALVGLVPDGYDAGTRPLCLACHPMD